MLDFPRNALERVRAGFARTVDDVFGEVFTAVSHSFHDAGQGLADEIVDIG